MPFRKTKKVVRKSKVSKVSSGIAKKLKQLVYQNKIMNKMFKATSTDVFYSTRVINSNIDAGVGAYELADRTSAISGVDCLPLVMIPLRNILNAGATGGSIYRLNQNGYDFTQTHNIEFGGSGDNSDSISVVNSSFDILLHRYTDIRLLLWQNVSKDAKFSLKLIKVKDLSLDPVASPTTTNGDAQDKRKLFYALHSLRHQLSNPLIKNQENFMKDIKRDFEVLWQKDVNISEQSNTLEESHYEEVKIFRKFDEIVRYTGSPTNQGDSIVDIGNADIVHFPSVTEVNNTFPSVNQAIFLMITANASKSDRDHSTLYNSFTFDISLKSKYTTSAQPMWGN